MLSEIAFDDLAAAVGTTFGPTKPRVVNQSLISGFAGITSDHQWVHVDVERAKAEIGHTIAHGYLVLSLVPSFTAELIAITGVDRAYNYGLNRVRFTDPVPGGAAVVATQTIKTVEPKGGGLLFGSEVVISVEGAVRPACIAETLVLALPGTGRL